MTFLYEPPDPADYVGGLSGSLEIVPDVAAPTTRFIIRGFKGISSDNTYFFNITANITVNTAAAPGVNALDAGALQALKNYTIWLIGDSTGILADAGLLSLSHTAPVMPAGYDQRRRIGSVTTTAGAVLEPVKKINDLTLFLTPVRILNTNLSFAAVVVDVGTRLSHFTKRILLRSRIDTGSPPQDVGVTYRAWSPLIAVPTYMQYEHDAIAEVGGVDAGRVVSSCEGWTDVEVIGTPAPGVSETVNFIHSLTVTGAVGAIEVFIAGYQELI